MKKQELKPGVAYFMSTDNRISAYWDSIHRTHEANISRRYYVVFEDGAPRTPYYSKSSVYVTHCKTYGTGCPTHKGEDGRASKCGVKEVRLMDIRGLYYETIANATRASKAKRADGGRGERYLRHIEKKKQREREAYEKPIKEELYKIISEVIGAKFGGYYVTDINRLTPEQMKKLTDALTVKAVA